MKCKYCGKEIDEGSIFCGYCGKKQPMVKHCIKCGQEIGLDDAFCGFCGASQNVENVTEEQGAQEESQALETISTEEVVAVDTIQNEENKVRDVEVESQVATDDGQEKSSQVESNITDDKSDNTTKYAVITLFVFLVCGISGYVFYSMNSHSNLSDNVYLEQTDSTESLSDSIDMEEPDTSFVTSQIKFAEDDTIVLTSIMVDYPMEGKKQLVESIRRYILEKFVKTYTWGETMPQYTGNVTDGQAIVDFYGKVKMGMLREESQRDSLEGQISEEISIIKKFETEGIVTYETVFSGFHGGVPDDSSEGASFLKKNGKRIAEIIKDPYEEGFQKLLVNYVGEEVEMDEDMYDIPMPKATPVLLSNGVTFNYSRGELAPMSIVSVTIPMNEIKDYLTDEVSEALFTQNEFAKESNNNIGEGKGMLTIQGEPAYLMSDNEIVKELKGNYYWNGGPLGFSIDEYGLTMTNDFVKEIHDELNTSNINGTIPISAEYKGGDWYRLGRKKNNLTIYFLVGFETSVDVMVYLGGNYIGEKLIHSKKDPKKYIMVFTDEHGGWGYKSKSGQYEFTKGKYQ